MSGLLVPGGLGGERGDRAGERAPLGGEGVGELLAAGGGAVELPRPGLLGVPGAGEQLLLLEAAQERVERVRVRGETVLRELLEQAVAVPGVRSRCRHASTTVPRRSSCRWVSKESLMRHTIVCGAQCWQRDAMGRCGQADRSALWDLRRPACSVGPLTIRR